MTEQKHFASLDGLRGIAAVLVLVHHAIDPFARSRTVPRASLAVDFFFLLSGFVIACAYEGRLRSNQLSFWGFVRVRVIRLYPLAFLGFALGLAVFIIKAFAARQTVGMTFVAASAAGLLMLPTPVQLAQGWQSGYPFNPPGWSLFFEFFINLVYAAMIRRFTLRALVCVVTLSGAALLVQESLVKNLAGGSDWSTFLQGFARVTFPFFLGVLLFRMESYKRGRQERFCVLLLLSALLFPVTKFDLLFENFTIFGLFPLIIFLGAASEPPNWSRQTLLAAGQISYPLYVLHYPLIHVFSTYFRTQHLSGLALYVGITIECLVAVVISFAVLRWVDKPLRRMLSRERKTEAAAPKAYVASA